MKIKELLDVAPEIMQLKIEIRENGAGRYIYKYDIAPHVEVPQSYPYARYKLEPKERLDLKTQDVNCPFPATFWAIDPHKAKEIYDLEISRVAFGKPMLSWLFKEYGSWVSCAHITAYPKDWVKPIQVSEHTDAIAGQMDIKDFLGGET